MKDYSEYTDEQLVDLIRDGDEAVTEVLLNKYKNLVRSKAGSMFILGADRDDLIQEGMIGIFKAIRDYDCGRDASFFTFAELCVSRQMYTAVKNSNRKKHTPLNAYISFYSAYGEDEDNDGQELLNHLVAYDNTNPENVIIDKENEDRIYAVMSETLSAFEKAVLDLHITGMSTSQIAKVLGKDPKSTDNALSRGKNKLKKVLV